MSKFIIEQKVNPDDKWKSYKKFKKEKRALQSLDTLKKHVSNIFKESEYMKYRLHDVEKNIYHT